MVALGGNRLERVPGRSGSCLKYPRCWEMRRGPPPVAELWSRQCGEERGGPIPCLLARGRESRLPSQNFLVSDLVWGSIAQETTAWGPRALCLSLAFRYAEERVSSEFGEHRWPSVQNVSVRGPSTHPDLRLECR